MELEQVRPDQGARRKKKRVGRGRASGHGKTSTRGHNGQGQRSGEAKRFGFEGGQTPLFRRLPKLHNFDSVPGRDWVIINVGDLNELPANTELTPDSMVELGLFRRHNDSVRVLGNGERENSSQDQCPPLLPGCNRQNPGSRRQLYGDSTGSSDEKSQKPLIKGE